MEPRGSGRGTRIPLRIPPRAVPVSGCAAVDLARSRTRNIAHHRDRTDSPHDRRRRSHRGDDPGGAPTQGEREQRQVAQCVRPDHQSDRPHISRRRHLLYELGEKHAAGDWTGFDRSLQDFEVRNFANVYEQLGLLARRGVVDVQDCWTLSLLSRWQIGAPSSRSERTSWTRRARPFPSWRRPARAGRHLLAELQWLAEESRKWTLQRASAGAQITGRTAED